MDNVIAPIIRYVRETSPYFKELYASVPEDAKLEDLPLVDHALYWAASNKDRRLVMTAPQFDGVVMKTGGTTARPKTTGYSQVELQRTTNLLARGLMAGGVRAGDRIANMFYAGDLYGSFLLHVLSIISLPVPAIHLPIGGLTAIADAVHLVEQCDANVLLTTATSLVKMAYHITSTGQVNETVRRVLFGGEPLFPEQESVIRSAFPLATVKSCIYGTIDAGVLATATPDDDTRVHQTCTESVIIEIVRNDGSNEVITEAGEPGILVATNTVRQLCPVIRYPTGDRAAWVDKEKGLFRLLGRASQAVRLGPVSLDMVDMRAIVAQCLVGTPIQGIQAVLSRLDGLDQLECLIAAQATDSGMSAEAITGELYAQRPMLKQHVDLKLVAPVTVRFVEMGELQLAKGSQKLLEVVDKRFDVARESVPAAPVESD